MHYYRDTVLAQFEHHETEATPYFLDFEPPVIDRLTRHFGTDAWRSLVEPYIYIVGGFYGWETMKYTPPYGYFDQFGSTWTQDGNSAHCDIPALSVTPYENYQYPTIQDFYSVEKKSILENDLQRHRDSFRVCNIGPGIFELVWRITGFENAFYMMIEEEDQYVDMLDHMTDLLLTFIDEAVKLPVDAIMLGDDWCDQRGVMMGADRWRILIKPRYEKLYNRIHAAGKKTITHVCGSVEPLINDLVEVGLDALESVQPEANKMDAEHLKRTYGDRIVFWGGLGAQKAVTFFTPDELTMEIKRLKSVFSPGGGYILAPSKTINDTVSTENAVAILRAFSSISF